MTHGLELDLRKYLDGAAAGLATRGYPRPPLQGKLLRPHVAYAAVPAPFRGQLPDQFWMAALAVQMVHEASLLHDDILDSAPLRRGAPSVPEAHGIGTALVLGDHLLTAAYVAASEAGSTAFMQCFIRAAERTVAGERAQAERVGQVMSMAEYRDIVSDKSGALFGAAYSAAAHVLGTADPGDTYALGVRLGVFYQMIDDLLDYCVGASTGKTALQDFRQRKWTWPFEVLELSELDGDVGRLEHHLEARSEHLLLSCRQRIEEHAEELLTDATALSMPTDLLAPLLGRWVERTGGSPRRLSSGRAPTPTPSRSETHVQDALRDRARRMVEEEGDDRYFAHHSKSFSLAARLFPAPARKSVASVYAYCRFTDDLVDGREHEDPGVLRRELDAWAALSRAAYDGEDESVALLNRAIGEMARRGVPFRYAEELIEGVRMDLDAPRYETMADLRVYSYRVASVVGGWITELFGVHDPWVLERAAALGHAMQLTNILRDVGEDLRMGRLYLPADLLDAHGLDREALERMERGEAPISGGYRALIEELMEVAERDYSAAFEALPALPPFFQRPVAVAAAVYRGIHNALRANDYDNLGRRAYTRLPMKLTLGMRGLIELRSARRRFTHNRPSSAVGSDPWQPSEADHEVVA
jgi:phytoene synthase